MLRVHSGIILKQSCLNMKTQFNFFLILYYVWMHRFSSLLYPCLWVKEHWPPHPPPQTVAQCKCGQNSYPQSPHTNKSFSAVERSTFLKLSLSWPKKSDLETFTGNLAFSDAAQIEDAMVAIGKSGLGKSGGWYVAAVGHNRRALHSRLSKGVAKKIEGDHPGT